MYSADKRMHSIQAGLNSLMNWTTNQIYPCLKLANSKNGQRLCFGNKSSEMVPNELSPTWPSPCDWNLRCFSVLISVLPNAESRRPLVARHEENAENPEEIAEMHSLPWIVSMRSASNSSTLKARIRQRLIAGGCKQYLELISFGIHLAGCNKYLQCIQDNMFVKPKLATCTDVTQLGMRCVPFPQVPASKKQLKKLPPNSSMASLMALLNSDLRRDLRLSVSRSRSHWPVVDWLKYFIHKNRNRIVWPTRLVT